MFIVLGLNQDEYGRGNSRPVHKFKTVTHLRSWLETYSGAVARLEIFEATEYKVNYSLDKVNE